MSDEPTLFYYAGPRKVPLELVNDTVAVGFNQPISERRLDELRASDRSIDILGQSLALLARNVLVYRAKVPTPGITSLRAFAERLLRGESVRFVTFIFREPASGLFLVMFDQIIVSFKPGVTQAQVDALAAQYGTQTIEQKLYAPNQHVMRVLNPSFLGTLETANRYHEDPLVEWAEPNFVMEKQLRLVDRQWHLNNIGQALPGLAAGVTGEDVDAEPAWAITRGSGNVVIAILDEGVELAHPGLRINIAAGGRNFDVPDTSDDPNPVGDGAHGTACAGVAAGDPEGGKISGIAPDCKILAIKMLTADNNHIADAVHYAAHHAQVLSNSWGTAFSITIERAFNDVIANGREGKGTVVLFAIGNDDARVSIGDQSTITGVIGVGASTNVGSRAGYSNFGDATDTLNDDPALRKKRFSVMGPSAGVNSLRRQNFNVGGTPDNSSENIYTTDIQGARGFNPPQNASIDPVADLDYTGMFSGTSSACPLVAGICALMLSVNADLTAAQVRYILEATAEKIGTNVARPDVPTSNATPPELAHYDANGYDVFIDAQNRALSRYAFGRANAGQAVKAAQGGPIRQLLRDASGTPIDVGDEILVTLTRRDGDLFVSEQLIELVDARRDSIQLVAEDRLFVRGGPGGFLRARFQPAEGGTAITDEVDIGT